MKNLRSYRAVKGHFDRTEKIRFRGEIREKAFGQNELNFRNFRFSAPLRLCGRFPNAAVSHFVFRFNKTVRQRIVCGNALARPQNLSKLLKVSSGLRFRNRSTSPPHPLGAPSTPDAA